MLLKYSMFIWKDFVPLRRPLFLFRLSNVSRSTIRRKDLTCSSFPTVIRQKLWLMNFRILICLSHIMHDSNMRFQIETLQIYFGRDHDCVNDHHTISSSSSLDDIFSPVEVEWQRDIATYLRCSLGWYDNVLSSCTRPTNSRWYFISFPLLSYEYKSGFFHLFRLVMTHWSRHCRLCDQSFITCK